jgi:hypothetical protein
MMIRSQHKQQGVFTVITALASVVLLAVVGLAVDASRLMVVRGELKNATEACALAAVAELNGQPRATEKAAEIGQKLTATWFKQDFQSSPVEVSITFGQGLNTDPYTQASETDVTSRVVKCAASYAGWTNFLMGIIGLAELGPTAVSIAGQLPGSKVCALPLALQLIPNTVTTYIDKAYTNADFALKVVELSASSLSTDSVYADQIQSYGVCNVATSSRTLLKRDPSMTITNALKARYDADTHAEHGVGVSPRLLSAVPVVTSTGAMRGWACVQWLQGGLWNYIGRADNSLRIPNSACVATGIAGGNAGPFVPVLLR